MFAITRRVTLGSLAILFAALWWASAPVRAADPIKVGFSMAKDAAVTVRIFSMTNPLRVWTASLRKPRMRQPRDAPLSSHHHLARAVSTAARLKNALTAFRTQ